MTVIGVGNMNTYNNEPINNNGQPIYMNTNNEFGNALFLPNNRRGILLVEDGSVDVTALEGDLMGMGIKILVYRSGSQKPEFIRLDK